MQLAEGPLRMPGKKKGASNVPAISSIIHPLDISVKVMNFKTVCLKKQAQNILSNIADISSNRSNPSRGRA